MASENDEKIETLVVDSAGFLKNVPLQNIARNVFTIKEVISEIRSAAVRERLAVLPYEVHFRVPSNQSLHVVSEFAKKTGDFQSLSIVDLKVLALTFQLHKEKCGKEGLREEPTKQIEIIDKQPQGKIPGFFVKTKIKSSEKKDEISNISENVDEQLASDEKDLLQEISDCSLNEAHNNEQNIEEKLTKPCENVNANKNTFLEVANCKTDEKLVDINVNEKYFNDHDNVREVDTSKDIINDDDDDGENNVDKDDDDYHNDDNYDDEGDDGENNVDKDDDDHNDDNYDDEGDDGKNNVDKYDDDHNDDNYDSDDEGDDGDWITPHNITQVKADFDAPEIETKPTNVVVGCLTTDFAMQNVLIQMGLYVISVDGMLIKEARSYVLKCHSCFKVTTQMQRLFCPKCGNRTLLKVAVSVDENGVTHYHMPKRKKPFNIRGKKHPLPLPKGGRYSNNPLLFEDQLISQKRLPKPKDNVNVLDQDYVARSSPFAVNDTTSRAFNLGFHVHGQNRRNPNEGKKKTRRKKK